MTHRRTLLTTTAALLALSLAAPLSAQADAPKRVVATFSILGDLVGRIGGEHIALTTLVGPDGDAHVYQPSPADARAVSEAEVLVINGLEFEGWLDRLAEAADFDGALVVASTGIEPIAFGEDDHDDHDDHDEHGHDEHGHDDDDHDHNEASHDDDDHDHDKHAEDADHDHDHDHAEKADHDDHDHGDHGDHDDHAGHDHGAFDPHAWQSIPNVVSYVDTITAALAQADPAHAGAFYENRAAFVSELEALETEIRALMAGLPEDRRTVVTPHDAFGYFAETYGLTFEAPVGLSTESEASAADVAALIEQIRDEGISAVFVESITDSRLLEQIASETGASIGGTLYSDALSGPDGPASTYVDMMRHNATTLAAALSN